MSEMPRIWWSPEGEHWLSARPEGGVYELHPDEYNAVAQPAYEGTVELRPVSDAPAAPDLLPTGEPLIAANDLVDAANQMRDRWADADELARKSLWSTLHTAAGRLAAVLDGADPDELQRWREELDRVTDDA